MYSKVAALLFSVSIAKQFVSGVIGIGELMNLPSVFVLILAYSEHLAFAHEWKCSKGADFPIIGLSRDLFDCKDKDEGITSEIEISFNGEEEYFEGDDNVRDFYFGTYHYLGITNKNNMPIYMLNKTIVRTHLTSNVTIQATIQSFLVVDWKNNERYWKVVDKYPINDHQTWLRNTDCNKKNVLECKSNWQVKVHPSHGAAKWLPKTDLIEVANERCDGGSRKEIEECCSVSSPCKEGQGDCDKNDECRGDLVCGRNNCGNKFSWKKADCCEKPSTFYSLVTDKGFCHHAKGGAPTNCLSTAIFSKSACEAACTSFSPCVGYSYHTKSSKLCYLMPSSETCPSGYHLHKHKLATSSSDLVAHPYPGFVCYSKGFGIPTYLKLSNRQCAVGKYGKKYSALDEAQNACTADSYCGGVYYQACPGFVCHFYLCPFNTTYRTSTDGSFIYKKSEAECREDTDCPVEKHHCRNGLCLEQQKCHDDEPLITNNITAYYPTGFGLPATSINYGSDGLVGHNWTQLYLEFNFGRPVTITGIKTDFKKHPYYMADPYYKYSIGSHMLEERFIIENVTNVMVMWERTDGSNGIHFQFIGCDYTKKVLTDDGVCSKLKPKCSVEDATARCPISCPKERDDYLLGNPNSSCRDKNFQELENVKECKKAFKYILFTYPDAKNMVREGYLGSPGRPKGCLFDVPSKTLYWNADANGSPHPDNRQVCDIKGIEKMDFNVSCCEKIGVPMGCLNHCRGSRPWPPSKRSKRFYFYNENCYDYVDEIDDLCMIAHSDEISSTPSQRPSLATSSFSTDGERSSTTNPNIETSSSTNSVPSKFTSNFESSSKTTPKKDTTSPKENQLPSSATSLSPMDGQKSSQTTPNVETSSSTNSVPSKSTSNLESSSKTTPTKGTTSPKENQQPSSATSLSPTDGRKSSQTTPNVETSSSTISVPSKNTSNLESSSKTTPTKDTTSPEENQQLSSATSSSPMDGQKSS